MGPNRAFSWRAPPGLSDSALQPVSHKAGPILALRRRAPAGPSIGGLRLGFQTSGSGRACKRPQAPAGLSNGELQAGPAGPSVGGPQPALSRRAPADPQSGFHMADTMQALRRAPDGLSCVRRQPGSQSEDSGRVLKGRARPGAHTASRNQAFIGLAPAGPSDGGPRSVFRTVGPNRTLRRRAPTRLSFGGPRLGPQLAQFGWAFIRRVPAGLS